MSFNTELFLSSKSVFICALYISNYFVNSCWLAQSSLSFLQVTQWCWAQHILSTEPEPYFGVERLSECAVEGVEAELSVREHCEEGQDASRPVHIHSDSVGHKGKFVSLCFFAIVQESILLFRADQDPGPGVLTPSYDSLISYPDGHVSFPLDLPVTTTSQTVSTQHLTCEIIMPCWKFYPCHLPHVVRQNEVNMGCIWVQCEIAGIWRKKTPKINKVINLL